MMATVCERKLQTNIFFFSNNVFFPSKHTLPYNSILTTLKKLPLENIAGKGKNAGNHNVFCPVIYKTSTICPTQSLD